MFAAADYNTLLFIELYCTLIDFEGKWVSQVQTRSGLSTAPAATRGDGLRHAQTTYGKMQAGEGPGEYAAVSEAESQPYRHRRGEWRPDAVADICPWRVLFRWRGTSEGGAAACPWQVQVSLAER